MKHINVTSAAAFLLPAQTVQMLLYSAAAFLLLARTMQLLLSNNCMVHASKRKQLYLSAASCTSGIPLIVGLVYTSAGLKLEDL